MTDRKSRGATVRRSEAAQRASSQPSAGNRNRAANAPGTVIPPQNVAGLHQPALSEEAKAQAERDRTGKTRAGFVRRDLPNGAEYAGVSYRSGTKVEIPQALADHLDSIGISPDASTEANRKTRFSGGKEDDQDAQGKAVKQQRDDALKNRVKHRQRPEFESIASPKKSGSKK